MQMKFEYQIAHDLDGAWLNFEPDIPLRPYADGRDNPFYVDRPDTKKTMALKKAVLRPFYQPQKFFFSGHRGCGKSTEMYRLAADPEVLEKFWPVHFSIRDHADINDVDFKDVLFIIGQQLFEQYQNDSERNGKKLDKKLLKELETWQGTITERVTTLKKGRMSGELGAEVGTVFAKLSSAIKLEPKIRQELRQELDVNITGLIAVINNIATAIYANEKRHPLVLIDDLDKPDLKAARQIFIDKQELMLRPLCTIVYTISSPLFYHPDIRKLRNTYFLPNIKLHEAGNRDARSSDGYYTCKTMVYRRLAKKANLIDDEALEMAVTMSGGVFRELAQIIRGSINSTDEPPIQSQNVNDAVEEIRRHYWRTLTMEQRQLLREIRADNQLRDPDEMDVLLQMLAVLEYSNGKVWCDIHPALHNLLDDAGTRQADGLTNDDS